MVKYLSTEDILQIHSFVVSETGGSHGIRDKEALLSIVASPRQIAYDTEFYPTIYKKAAVYIRGIVMSHPFIDGNKRAGITAGIVFLRDNEVNFKVENGEVERFTLSVIEKRLEIKEIAEWLEKNSKAV